MIQRLPMPLAYFGLKSGYVIWRALALLIVAPHTADETYADLALALLFAETTRYLADWGSEQVSVKRVLEQPAAAQDLWSLKLLLAILHAAANCLMLVLLFPRQSSSVLAGIAVLAALPSLGNFLVSTCYARNELSAAILPMTLAMLLAASGILAASHTWPLQAVVPLMLLAELAQLGVAMAATLPRLQISLARMSWPKQATQVLRAGTPLALAQLLALIYVRADVIVLRVLAPAVEQARYVFALRSVDVAVFFSGGVGSWLYIVFCQLQARGWPESERLRLQRNLRRLWLAAIAAVVVVWECALPAFIEARYPQFFASVPLIRVMGCTVLAVLGNQTCTALIQSGHRAVWITCINAASLALIYASLVPAYRGAGPLGIALAVLAIYTLSALVQTMLARRLLRSAVHAAGTTLAPEST